MDQPLDRVLFIGGCGALGHHIVKQLIQIYNASNVTVFDVNTNNNRIDGATYIQGSLTSQNELLAALCQAKPTVVFNTASPQLMAQKNSNDLFDKVNVKGMQTLLDGIKAVGTTNALIYTSSSSVVHNNLTDLVEVTEKEPLYFEPEQTEHYTHTKSIAEEMLRAANGQNGLLTATLRASLLFSEGDTTSTSNIVENATKALLQESVATEQIPEDKKVNGEAFVITNDGHWLFWDYIRVVGAAAGHPVKKEEVWVIPAWLCYCIAALAEWAVWVFSFRRKESYINRRMAKYFTMNRTFDISKAKQRLGYEPQVGMEEGIQRVVESYLASEEAKN